MDFTVDDGVIQYIEIYRNVSSIEAKVTALETLCKIADSCLVAFGPFMQEAYTKALEIASLEGTWKDEILGSSVTSFVLSLENYIPTLSDEYLNVLIKNTAQIASDYNKIFRLVCNKSLEDETKVAITRLIKRVQTERAGVLESLDEEEKAAIQMACV